MGRSGQCMKGVYLAMTTASRGGLTTVTVVVHCITSQVIKAARTCCQGVTKCHTL